MDIIEKAFKTIMEILNTSSNKQDWPACGRFGCANRVCLWSSNDLCYPHEEELVGKAEMDKRYDMTHERPWAEASVSCESNPMTKTFKELAG